MTAGDAMPAQPSTTTTMRERDQLKAYQEGKRLLELAMDEAFFANLHKGGWRDCEPLWLLKRLAEEVEELREALERKPHEFIGRVQSEGGDVGLFVLFILDVVKIRADCRLERHCEQKEGIGG